MTRPPAFPDGHFYSPAVDPKELRGVADRLWPNYPPPTPGIDWNEMEHRQVLDDLRAIAAEYQYPTKATDTFYEPNGIYEGLDARMLYGFLRFFRPARMIEVGSGMSTLLAADVNARYLAGAMDFTAIEPFPPAFLGGDLHGLSRLIRAKVQDVTIESFTRLRAGEILFIDSSHVAKTGNDVNFLYHLVLPRLASGVIIHVHDIFLPWDYPFEWVMSERRNWNEQYLLQTMLAGSHRYEVLFANHYEVVEDCWGQRYGGGSIWLRVI
jgi:hypothetical protein